MPNDPQVPNTRDEAGALPAGKAPNTSFEMIVAVAVVFMAALHVALYIEQMMHGSLWTDELGAIKDFFEPGPLYAVTHYPIPRNHIFFSFLNSLFPHAGDVNPVRAQMLSYVFAVVLGAGIVWSFFRRCQFFEGAVMFALWGLNGELLQLSLQARGYGLLCLFAFWSSVLTLRYLEGKRAMDFALLGVCTVLGSYTIPSYVFFGGPLMLVIAARERDRRAFWMSVCAGAAIALLYAPVAAQMMHAITTYKEKYGEYYTSLGSVVRTLRAYVWPLPGWQAVTVFAATCALAFVPWSAEPKKARAMQSLLIAVAVFLGACLWMRTPPVRTTSFVSMPLLFCFSEIAGRFYREVLRGAAMRLALCAILFGGTLAVESDALTHFRFVPYENWELVWRFLETMYPRGTLIDCSHTANGLTYYIDQDHYGINLDRPLDTQGFVSGKVPVVVAQWKNEADKFPASDLSTQAVAVTAPGIIRNVTVHFAIPADKMISHVQEERQANGTMFEFTLNNVAAQHSLNLVLGHAQEDIPITAVEQAGNQSTEIDSDHIVRIGDVITIPLSDRQVERVIVKFAAPAQVHASWAVLSGNKFQHETPMK